MNDFQREHGPFASPWPSWWGSGPPVLITAGVKDRLHLVADSDDPDWLRHVTTHIDHPEVWGEDCPSYQNHLLQCPECRRRELAERRKANPPNDKLTDGAGK